MLFKMWEKGIPQSPMLEVQTGAATLEISVESFKKAKRCSRQYFFVNHLKAILPNTTEKKQSK